MKVCQACQSRFQGPWRCPACGWEAPSVGGIHVLMPSSAPRVGFEAQFFEMLDPVEATHFWFDARNALIEWALGRYFPDAQTFLEVGCGTGQVVAALQRLRPALRQTACEAFLEGLQIAKRKAPSAELVQADARHLPYEAEFDVVGAFDVLEHIAEHEAAARELVRAVKPGGGVLITVPQHARLWSPLDEYAGHERRYSRAALRRLLEGAGLRVERLTSFVSLLLPPLFVSRLLQRGRPADPDAEFRISPGLNRVGALIMGAERTLIRAGVPLPAGGSLLAVARRPS